MGLPKIPILIFWENYELHYDGLCFLAERFGSGDGERKTLLTRQIAFEPLPASVLFGPFSSGLALVLAW